jgi:hypothetical protein
MGGRSTAARRAMTASVIIISISVKAVCGFLFIAVGSDCH